MLVEIKIKCGTAPENSIKEIKPYDGETGAVQQMTAAQAIMNGATLINPPTPIRVDYNGGGYEFSLVNDKKCNNQFTANDKGLFEKDDGYFLAAKHGDSRVANFIIRIMEHIKIIYNDVWEYYRCQIYCCDEGVKRYLYIRKERYKDIFKIIKREFPSTFSIGNISDEIEIFLANLINLSKDKWEEKVYYAKRGWNNNCGVITYESGITDKEFLKKLDHSFYDYSSAPIPNMNMVSEMDKLSIFKRGCDFLSIGKKNKEITAIYLFAHIGYLIYWMKHINFNCNFILYMFGRTNSFKTSVIKAIINPFERDASRKMLRFTSTKAAAYDYLDSHQDDVIAIDDYSNTEKRTQKSSLEMAELILRAVGDGNIPTKMNNQGEINYRDVHVAVVMTGETMFDLPASSQLRLFSINVDKNSFDGVILSEYQRKPDIMRKYFALFLQFLSMNGTWICQKADEMIFQLRQKYAGRLEPRQVDIAVWYEVLIMVWLKFGIWAGADEAMLYDYSENFREKIMALIHENENNCKLSRPSIKFIYALSRMIARNSRVIIADNEGIFVKNEKLYLGFYERGDNDELWVVFDAAFELVKNYWKNLGSEFLSTEIQVKESLNESGFIRTCKTNKNRNEYVIKAKKGRRQRMLVLLRDKCLKALEEVSI